MELKVALNANAESSAVRKALNLQKNWPYNSRYEHCF